MFRAQAHVSNHHKGLLDAQVEELRQVKQILHDVLSDVESMLNGKQTTNIDAVVAKERELRSLAERLHQEQLERIRNESSKTRLTILFYAILGNAVMLCRQNVRLLEIYAESFGHTKNAEEFDLD